MKRMAPSGLFLWFSLCALSALCGQSKPAKWGSDHVGKPLPEFVTGGECLFCHRNDVGPSWGKNRHQCTIRDVDDEKAALKALGEQAKDVELLLGGEQRVRFLKRSKDYGKLDLLTTAWSPADGKLVGEKPHWDGKQFADQCAGCHATAVDAKTRAFAAVSLDCFACHGDVAGKHTTDGSLVYLAKKRNDPPRVVISACAQCHVRTGKAKSTGLPYPNHFVAGDNLFLDFQADLSVDALARLNIADRHVLENVRAVAVNGKEELTCLSCHDVHAGSSKKHQRVKEQAACVLCHPAGAAKKDVKPFDVHSERCGY